MLYLRTMCIYYTFIQSPISSQYHNLSTTKIINLNIHQISLSTNLYHP